MGFLQHCFCCHINRHLIISMLFLLISSLTHVRFMAEARRFTKLVEAGQMETETDTQKGWEGKVAVAVRAVMIGSRPPRCERKCFSCRRCEAIQVPVGPQLISTTSVVPTISYARGDDVSNYKPMCWKCKCGDLIFNP